MTTIAYTLTFSDGKRCTLIDPERQDFEQLVLGLKQMFHEGYLVSVVPMIDASAETEG